MGVQNTEGDLERLSQLEKGGLRSTHDIAPCHCSPDVLTRLEQRFVDIGGRTVNKSAGTHGSLQSFRGHRDLPVVQRVTGLFGFASPEFEQHPIQR